ncbi:AAA ATPase domain-containing protein [Heterostelium album PN500]|uniref:AAA ATPase domain-containing protein n=1 Tax=Heterostelium pallidum (strain ATCC 26659 / Pp 5 / PN500) TaxID=670386 RepID=D3BTY0_HETP5|nr:AAA ATPase domain-containing protein [Heterostelium album PN500]EFA75166.1 AAA ATPase domain-containing protein [Heterostelium album PN500]|eukprot:XP_020427300.1 AAA ATPase domain-containing protein [Heterostelium album PN500]
MKSILGQKRRIFNDGDDFQDVDTNATDDSDRNHIEKKHKLSNSSSNDIDSKKYDFDSVRSCSTMLFGGNFQHSYGVDDEITITSFSGERIYNRLKKDEEELDYYSEESVRNRINLSRIGGSLLGKSISELDTEISEHQITKALKANSAATITYNNKTTTLTNKGNKKIDNRLWVDKYAPDSFHELLSDDKLNKDILLWLKHWDYSVFGKQINSSSSSSGSGNGNNSTTTTSSGSDNNKNQAQVVNWKFQKKTTTTGAAPSKAIVQQHNNGALDAAGQPNHKIILLTGGPGLGKTTLAHILAKQAGYNPIEINASFERSGEKFETKFLAALEMQSVFANQKPTCLIIDEIDGISGGDNGPVELILKLIANSKKLNSQASKTDRDIGSGSNDVDMDDDMMDEFDNGGSVSAKPKKSGKGKKPQLLPKINRPIICICNDHQRPIVCCRG